MENTELVAAINRLREEVTQLKSFLTKSEPIVEKTFKNTSQKTIEKKVDDLLNQLKIPINLLGYVMLKDSIMKLLVENRSRVRSSELYDFISETHNSTPQRVERAIRYSIDYSWDRASRHKFYNNDSHRPTNVKFVLKAVQTIKEELED